MHCGMTHRSATVRLLLLATLWLLGSSSLLAQTFTTLYLFGGGGGPRGTLIEGTDGDLYGTTYGAGSKDNGMIFKITPGASFTMLHQGGTFDAGLTLGTDGNFYGTSISGGLSEALVFKITPSGAFTTLHTLPGGSLPQGLVQASDGNFYGTTLGGGTGGGMLFRITPSGTLTTLYNFCAQSGCADGFSPLGLIQGMDGNLYGATGGGGGSTACSTGCGTIFKITTTGTLTTLHRFDFTDGAGPEGLVQAGDGNFYGTTNSGGLSNGNCVYGNIPATCGTVFKMTATGELTTLHTFNYTDGGNPGRPPIEARDGNIYGTTADGGSVGSGTVFKITPAGTLTTVHNFDTRNGDGSFPGELVQHTNGTFYGPTVRGGEVSYHFCALYCGTLFSLSVP
jgi:uncharacterized repeat protein (TIGR03803 family)